MKLPENWYKWTNNEKLKWLDKKIEASVECDDVTVKKCVQ